jgi:hypothetical protein
VGVKQKHIKHILGKIGTVKEVRNIPDMEILAYFVHFPYVNLKAAPGNKKPYYVLLEDMIEPINLTVIEGKGEVMTEVPKEWKGTPEEWNAVVEAFGRIAKAIQEAGRQIVNSFSELYKRMAEAMGSEQAKKRLWQQSIRDRKKQLERSRKRQQLAAANTDKSNNWRRLHGLCTRRKYKKHAKKN